jgi:carbonic anhydrase
MTKAPRELGYLKEGVRRFRTEVFPRNRELYESLAEKQAPYALFLTCGDSRIAPSILTGTDPGRMFVERTPGNIVPIYDETASVGVSASIEYSIVVLGVHDVVICGHSACGAMKGLLHQEHLNELPATARWLKYARPAVEVLEQRYSALSEKARLKKLCQLNVIEQMAHLQTHPAVEERFKSGRLGIHGWYYEIHTGRVEAYNQKTGEFEDWPAL